MTHCQNIPSLLSNIQTGLLEIGNHAALVRTQTRADVDFAVSARLMNTISDLITKLNGEVFLREDIACYLDITERIGTKVLSPIAHNRQYSVAGKTSREIVEQICAAIIADYPDANIALVELRKKTRSLLFKLVDEDVIIPPLTTLTIEAKLEIEHL